MTTNNTGSLMAGAGSSPSTEESTHPNEQEALRAVRTILRYINVNPDNPDVLDTPARYLRALGEMTQPGETTEDVLGKTFPVELMRSGLDVVAQVDIRFSALCQHHMLPFWGWVDIAYLPASEPVEPGLRAYLNPDDEKHRRKLLGLSKLSRLVGVVSRTGLQLQEGITAGLVEALSKNECSRRGSLVIVRARHGCMSCRGVQQQATTATTGAGGLVATKPEYRQLAEQAINSARMAVYFSKRPSSS